MFLVDGGNGHNDGVRRLVLRHVGVRRGREHGRRVVHVLTHYSYIHSVVVVYQVTIVAIGHGLLKKFWPFGTRLRSTHCREFNYLKTMQNRLLH